MPAKSIGLSDILNSIGSPKLKAIKILDLAAGGFLSRVVPRRPFKDAPAGAIHKILVIRPGGIGDAIFILPFLKVIRKERPGIVMDILCEKRNSGIFTSQRAVCDGIFCYDQLNSFGKIWRNHYDVIIDTEQWHYLSALVSYFVKGQFNTGFASRPSRARLFNKTVSYENDAYEIENFRNLFLPLFQSVSQVKDIRDSFSVDEQAMAWAQEKMPRKFEYITLFLGASIPLRRLSFDQSKEITRVVLNKNQAVALLGGLDVLAEAESLVGSFTDSRVRSWVGKASLAQTAALIKNSSLFIGPDSGIMHLAGAVGTPVIAVFGPGNLKKWSPHGHKDKIITLDVECSPCTRFGYTVPTCQGIYKCMRNIKLGPVLGCIPVL